MPVQFNPALGETVKVRRTIGGKSVLTKGTVVAFKSGGYSVRQKAFLQSVGIQFRKGGGIVYFAKSSVLPATSRGMRVANPGRKVAFGNKRDYPKIDIYVKRGPEWRYVATTTWSPTLRDAKVVFLDRNPDFTAAIVKVVFQSPRKRNARKAR